MNIENSNVFVVGAGGIGCELLKNLVLTGFKNISLIDLDTIEISNLNRQFLFQKSHVGQSKALVAKESILRFRPNVKINAFHDTINNPKYDVAFFRKFQLVFSALDNIAVRYHLNRMCLAAEVPLIESGTSGLYGQVKPIFKGISECYDCLPRISSKTNYASCTIRNTPSEPVHCIVWAKNLFNVLFGEPSIDNDEDQVAPELNINDSQNQSLVPSGDQNKNGTNSGVEDKSSKPPQISISTYQWAQTHSYDPQKVIWKLFKADVEYLVGLVDLWTNRKPPTPLDEALLVETESSNDDWSVEETEAEAEQRKVWDLDKCLKKFGRSLTKLRAKMGTAGTNYLTWDKDDGLAMELVAAASNIRSYLFHIPPLSLFQAKSMAGNIIPALSTTNAIIAGLIVAQACDILAGQKENCKTLFLRTPNSKNFHNSLIGVEQLKKPNPKCYSCAPTPQVYLSMDLGCFLVKDLIQVLTNELSFSQPDISIDDGKGTVLVSSEPDETTDNEVKTLQTFGLREGSRLVCDDFLQNYVLVVILVHRPHGIDRDPRGYEISGDVGKITSTTMVSDKPTTSASHHIQATEAFLQFPPVLGVAERSLKRKTADYGEGSTSQNVDDSLLLFAAGGNSSKKSRLQNVPSTGVNNYVPPLPRGINGPKLNGRQSADDQSDDDLVEIGRVAAPESAVTQKPSADRQKLPLEGDEEIVLD